MLFHPLIFFSNLKALHSLYFLGNMKNQRASSYFVFSLQEKFMYSYENCVAAAKRENNKNIFNIAQVSKRILSVRASESFLIFFIIFYSIHRDYLYHTYIHNKNSILLTTWILSFCLTLHVLFCCFARSFFSVRSK